MWNLVGFQTRLKTGAQQKIFRTIPGLGAAEFLRFGSIHRNSYLNAPQALTAHLSAKDDPQLLFAGQLTGVEGYTESAATGMLAGLNLARLLAGEDPVLPPPTTMLGALYRYLRETEPGRFQPMNANFGLMEPLEPPVRDKFKKKEALAERDARARGQPRAGGANSQARPDVTDLLDPSRSRTVVCRRRSARGGRRISRSARSRDARAVLFDRHAALGAGGAERSRRRSRVRSGQGARQGKEGAYRSGRVARHGGAAHLPAPAGPAV